MSLTIHDNKITHQTDYVDYHSVNNQVAKLKAEFGRNLP